MRRNKKGNKGRKKKSKPNDAVPLLGINVNPNSLSALLDRIDPPGDDPPMALNGILFIAVQETKVPSCGIPAAMARSYKAGWTASPSPVSATRLALEAWGSLFVPTLAVVRCLLLTLASPFHDLLDADSGFSKAASQAASS